MFSRIAAFFRASREARIALIALIVVLVLIVVGTLVALRGHATSPTSPSGSSQSPTVIGPSQTPPAFDPTGTAAANLSFFNWVNAKTISEKQGKPAGPDFINGLIAAGFDRSKMQVTPDTTAAGLQADSIQFSVQMGTQCLIGQWGAGSNGYQSEVANVIDGIGCLIGKTRPIDW